VSASLLSTFQQNKIADSKVNRGNAIYLLPQYDLIGEFRPNLTVHYKRNTTFTLRPRLTVQQQRIVKSEPNMAQSKDKQSIFINESFLANIYSDSFQSVIGLQNFQWGPTELLSPSNIIFNDLGINRNFFYETRGKSLVRLNYAPSGQLSLILLAELLENGEKAPAYEDGFRQKGVLKAEFADQTQTNYLGAVLGVKKQNQPSFGLYGNYSTDFGISFYFDGKTGRGSQVLYPAIDAPVGPSFGKSSLSLESYKSTILTGIRYSFESGSDIRVEGVLDQTAWSKEDRDLGVVVLAQAPTERNFKLFIQPGSALPGREFIYTSARIPEFGWRDSLNLNARLLHSLTDSTQLRIVNLDTYLTDQLTFSGGFTTTGMREDGELTQLYRMTVFASLAVNF
jgi:hypothetical protein